MISRPAALGIMLEGEKHTYRKVDRASGAQGRELFMQSISLTLPRQPRLRPDRISGAYDRLRRLDFFATPMAHQPARSGGITGEVIAAASPAIVWASTPLRHRKSVACSTLAR